MLDILLRGTNEFTWHIIQSKEAAIALFIELSTNMQIIQSAALSPSRHFCIPLRIWHLCMLSLLLSVQSTVEFIQSMCWYSRNPEKSAAEENSPKYGSPPKGLLKCFYINCCNNPWPLVSYSINFFNCVDSTSTVSWSSNIYGRNRRDSRKNRKGLWHSWTSSWRTYLNEINTPHISGAAQLYEQ